MPQFNTCTFTLAKGPPAGLMLHTDPSPKREHFCVSSQGTQKCSLGFGQEHRLCAKHHSGGEVGPPPNIISDLGVEEGVGGVMTTGVLGGVGAGGEGVATVTGGLIVWPAPHSSSD